MDTKKFGFWTVHELRSNGGGLDSFPIETQLSGLFVGVPLIHGNDEPVLWMLREIFDTFDDGKEWMDNVFNEIDWKDYLISWKKKYVS